MHIPYRFTRKAYSMREQRLMGFSYESHKEDDDMQRLLETSRQTGGLMERKAPVDAMEGETQELIKKIGKTRVGWKEWFNNFFRSGAALDARNYNTLWNAARKEIDQRGRLAIGRIRGFLQPGKRRLYLQAMHEVMQRKRQDLERYLKSELVDRSKESRGLASEIRKSGPLKLNMKHREKVLNSLARLRLGSTKKIDPKTKKIWQEAIGKERDIGDTLLRLNVFEDPYDVDQMLNANRSGYKTLERIVRKSEAFDSDEDGRTRMINSLRAVRGGTARYSQVQRGLEGDRNIGGVRNKLNALKSDPNVFERTLRFAPDGSAPEDAKVTYCQNGMVTARSASGTDYVLSLKTQKFTARDAAGREYEGRLNNRNFLVN